MNEADGEPTCGKGLAAHSALPLKMAELTAAVGRVLELHLPSLDPADGAASAEIDAYTSLVPRHREAAGLLLALGAEMAGYRDLPAAPHDEPALATAENLEAFRRLVELEAELADLLARRLDSDRAMLAEWEADPHP
jgi:hypothetical protein